MLSDSSADRLSLVGEQVGALIPQGGVYNCFTF
jgi:hypothetical protein